MRRIIGMSTIIGFVVLAGCTATPAPPTATSQPPAATATAIPPTDTPQPTSTTEPTAAIPTATQPVATATSPSNPGSGSVSFNSPALGISFKYQPNQGGQTVAAKESGDKVYVYTSNMAPTAGQWVQVFQKPAAQSLLDAIKAQVLNGYSPTNCWAISMTNPNNGTTAPGSYTFARVAFPFSQNDSPETIQANAAKCPQPYAAFGGLAYFVMDSNHPDRFAFFSIGQYWIMGDGAIPWQATLTFITANPGSATAIPPSGYIDDRSTAETVMMSYVNALNRKEYARAYYYWEPGAAQLQPFDQFQQGFANTASVQLTIGTVSGDAGAGQLYWSVPVLMQVQTTGGGQQTFVGCYTLHLSQPAVQGVPPFQPLAIRSAQVQQLASGANASDLLAHVCDGQGHAIPTLQAYSPGDISSARYLDDRSDGLQAVRSYFNAINRHEFVRAYSYWEPAAAASSLPPFDQFQQGYANTQSVQLTTGQVTSDAGAGQIYWNVPVALVAQTTGGATQTFVGCYTLHLAQPGIQGAPPFQALGVRSAQLNQVPNGSNTTALMNTACH